MNSITLFSFFTSTWNYNKRIGILVLLLYGQVAYTQNANIKDSVVANFVVKGDISNLDFFNTSLYEFTPNPGRSINFGFTGDEFHYVLLKLVSDRQTDKHCLLIDNTSLDTIRVYNLIQGKIPDLVYVGGSLVPFDDKRYSQWHIVQLDLSSQPSLYIIAVKAAQKNIYFTYDIVEQDKVYKSHQDYQKFVFFYVGIAVVISLIIFLAFILFRRRVFGCYLGYMICVSIWIIAHYGILFPLLYPNMPRINEIIKPLSSLGATYFLLSVIFLIFKEFFSRNSLWRLLIITIRYILLAIIGLEFLLYFPEVNSSIKSILVTSWHIIIIISVCLIISTPIYLFRTNNVARIFSVAMVIVFVMAIVQFLGNTGVVYNYFLNEHGTALGTLLENSIMAAGLIYGLLEERRMQQMQLRTMEDEQLKILNKLISVQDNERKRIAGDLHDTIGPLLAAIKINFRRLITAAQTDLKPELVQSTELIIDDSINEIRTISHNLMPKGLSSKGLINTLSDYFADLQALYNKPIHFAHTIESILDPDLQLNLYRIICEITLNAAKHSNASLIDVAIISGKSYIDISIDDNGQGFQPIENNTKISLGLQNAESRVQYLRGEFDLTSEVGKGTSVKIKLPL